MKTPPNTPEFARFTAAMRDIVKVSKAELQNRMAEEKRKPNASASRDSVDSSSGPKRQNG